MKPVGPLGVASLLPLLFLAGCRGGQNKAPGDPLLAAIRAEEREGNLSDSESQGRRLFLQYCSTCHGDEGKGDGQNASNLNPPPPDMTTPKSSQDVQYVRRVIVEGSAAVGRSPLSPPWGRSLSRQQIDGLVAYCQSLNLRKR
jgi:mono/diheme cytochrome c family protein